MINSIKTGMLSFGMLGKTFHAPFLSEHLGFELDAVAERTEKKAKLIYPKIKNVFPNNYWKYKFYPKATRSKAVTVRFWSRDFT